MFPPTPDHRRSAPSSRLSAVSGPYPVHAMPDGAPSHTAQSRIGCCSPPGSDSAVALHHSIRSSYHALPVAMPPKKMPTRPRIHSWRCRPNTVSVLHITARLPGNDADSSSHSIPAMPDCPHCQPVSTRSAEASPTSRSTTFLDLLSVPHTYAFSALKTPSLPAA